MNFIPNTPEDRKRMMASIGITKIEQLFKDIPKNKLLKKWLNIPDGLSEIELKRSMTAISEKNKHWFTSFLGAGAYNHFIPAIVNHLVSRSEFYTAYTPYQAEASQGILQAIYEWQTLISELCGMDVANASMYDGSTALAEGMFMTANISQRREIIVSSTIHPEYRDVVRTYANAKDLKLIEINFEDGTTSLEKLKDSISEATAAVLVQSPNFFGLIEDIEAISKIAHEKGALLVVCVNEPTSLGILKPPGEYGADIVVGEAQGFGNPVSFGGPGLGFIATKKEFVRQIPGRLVGATVDAKGGRGFVLTLQAREQHIRREQASSNICSNEALCALAATIWMVTLGKKLKELAELNLQKAHFVCEELEKRGFERVFSGPFYNEFLIKCKDGRRVQQELLKNGIMGGLDAESYYPQLKNCLLFCVTEMTTREDVDKLLKVVGGSK